MSSKIIKTLISHHQLHRLTKGDVSLHTKSAQRITRDWQRDVVDGKAIKAEVPVSKDSNEKFDLVDFESLTVYEVKVSGKNTHHEFYKDLIKLLTYNCHHTPKLKKLVFLSENDGIQSLNNRLDPKFKNMLLSEHGITLELISLISEEKVRV